ncbi:unnamed protein product [Rotaria sp. Silwood1]|nr:unnamed protein product [Rotaria sp. Silwood1]
MSQSCSVKKCTRTSRWVCDCCQQNFCLQHLNEHNAFLTSQLNSLNDNIKVLRDRLKTLNIHTAIANSRRKLEEWRQDCCKKIDCLFEQKCQELDQLVEEKIRQQREELNRIYSKITELINAQETTRQDIDLFTLNIRQLETNMNNIEQTCFTINTHPLVIDDKFTLIKTTTERELDLLTLSPVYRTMRYPKESFVSLISNDRYLMMHQQPNLCLVDREMNIVKQKLWSYGPIWDMCWSSTLDKFIVLEKNNIYLVDENKMSGEWWLDIRRLDILGPIMRDRLDLAKNKSCDGVEPDNIDVYTQMNGGGFRITYRDQLTYNIWLAQEAHARDLSIGLKNDVDQVRDLVSYFDWAINEQCWEYNECNTLQPFITGNFLSMEIR